MNLKEESSEQMLYNLRILYIPFPGNTNGGVDAAAKRYIVKRVEDLGEDIGVHGAVSGEGPRPN